MDDILINYGGELKAVQSAPDTLDFKARLVTFGDPADPLSGHDSSPLMDLFSVKTDFDIEDGDRTTLYYHHGLDPELKRRKLGSATLSIKDDGVWMEGQLKARDAYEKRIQEMIRAGKLGVSSGVPAHLVERHDIKTERGTVHHVDLWPLGKDASFTPTPAEARCGVYALKSLLDTETSEDVPAPDAPKDDYSEFFDEPSTKNLDQLAADSQGSLRFLDHSARLHDAVTEWTDRFTDWAGGFDAVKSGRTLTREKQTHLSTVADCLHESAATMRAFLDAHAPETETVPDNADGDNATKSIDAAKSIEHGWQSYVERELAQSGLTL